MLVLSENILSFTAVNVRIHQQVHFVLIMLPIQIQCRLLILTKVNTNCHGWTIIIFATILLLSLLVVRRSSNKKKKKITLNIHDSEKIGPFDLIKLNVENFHEAKLSMLTLV